MHSFNNKPDLENSIRHEVVTVGRADDVPPGGCVTVELSDGNELALYNVAGDFFATENFCPHKGAPLAEGRLCGHIIECDWHGWEFDVRTGACLNSRERVKVYKVAIEDGWIKIDVRRELQDSPD